MLRMVLRVDSLILQMVAFEVVAHEKADEKSIHPTTAVPWFRIVGYDPKTKATAVFVAEPEYIVQVAGGVHSGYLDISRRKELARIVCESLTVVQRRGMPFELSPRQQTYMKSFQRGKSGIHTDDGDSIQVSRRRGKIGRFASNVSGIHVVLTFYSIQGTHPSRQIFESDASHDLIVNVYSQQRSWSRDLVISTQEQVERIGRSVLSYKDGLARTTALRHLSTFITLTAENSLGNDLSPEMVAALLPTSQEFLPHYENLKIVDPGVESRPIGAPVVFLPLNTCGDLVHRRIVSMFVIGVDRNETFIISVHCKAPAIGPEKGLVVKLYESVSRQTVVMHIGPVQLERSCAAAGRVDLLQAVAVSFINTAAFRRLDPTEQSLLGLTEQGDELNHREHLLHELVDILLEDMEIRLGELNTYIPIFLSAPKAI